MADVDQTRKAKPPDPAEIDMPPSSYQPSKVEFEEEIDMPGWSLDQVHDTFMRPFMARNS